MPGDEPDSFLPDGWATGDAPLHWGERDHVTAYTHDPASETRGVTHVVHDYSQPGDHSVAVFGERGRTAFEAALDFCEAMGIADAVGEPFDRMAPVIDAVGAENVETLRLGSEMARRYAHPADAAPAASSTWAPDASSEFTPVGADRSDRLRYRRGDETREVVVGRDGTDSRVEIWPPLPDPATVDAPDGYVVADRSTTAAVDNPLAAATGTDGSRSLLDDIAPRLNLAPDECRDLLGEFRDCEFEPRAIHFHTRSVVATRDEGFDQVVLGSSGPDPARYALGGETPADGLPWLPLDGLPPEAQNAPDGARVVASPADLRKRVAAASRAVEPADRDVGGESEREGESH